MTRAAQQATALVRAWYRKAHPHRQIRCLRHVQPRGYVVGRAAARCLVVAVPWMDAEPQMWEGTRAHPLTTVHEFDPSLKPGDWCACAYVSTLSSGEPVAVAWPEPKGRAQ